MVSINVDLAVIKLFNQIHANTFSKSNDLVNSVLVVNPSQERIQKEVLKKLQGKDPKLEQEAKRLMGYNWKYNGIQTNSWISFEYVIIDVTALFVYVGSSVDIGRSPMNVPRLPELVKFFFFE